MFNFLFAFLLHWAWLKIRSPYICEEATYMCRYATTQDLNEIIETLYGSIQGWPSQIMTNNAL